MFGGRKLGKGRYPKSKIIDTQKMGNSEDEPSFLETPKITYWFQNQLSAAVIGTDPILTSIFIP